MKSVIYGLAAMVAISAVAWVIMGNTETTSSERFVSQYDSVRLD
ncbi:MAG: hypothetical protein ACR2O3_02755 [Rhizobiaceae bacterium]